MKILEVTFYLASGGAERLLVDLSNELSQNHEVVLLTLKDDTVEPEKPNITKLLDGIFSTLNFLWLCWNIKGAVNGEIYGHNYYSPIYRSLQCPEPLQI